MNEVLIPSTIQQVIHNAADELKSSSDTARLDAEILLADLLQSDRTALFMRWPEIIDPKIYAQFTSRIARRRQQEPVAYIIGKKYFWESEFAVSPEVLIPRPDTETLVELACQAARHLFNANQKPLAVIDLGTGSGCIGISVTKTLYKELVPMLERVVLTDISQSALSLATCNAQTILDEYAFSSIVEWVKSDWFQNVTGRFDLVLSNPPYIAARDPRVYEGGQFEPKNALYSEDLQNQDDGLACIHHLLKYGKDYVKPGGSMFIEFGEGQADAIRQLWSGLGFIDCELSFFKDLTDKERVAQVQKLDSHIR